MEEQRTRWSALVSDLVTRSSQATVAANLGVDPKEVNRWKEVTSEGV